MQHSSKTVQKPSSPASPSSPTSSQDEKVDKEVVWEFGGPIGVTFMMIFFPLLMFYLFICLHIYHGKLQFPDSIEGIPMFFSSFYKLAVLHASPTLYAAKIYILFFLWQALLAYVMPGVKAKGFPIPSECNRQLEYLCNGVSSFYLTLVAAALIHYYDIWRLTEIVDNFGPIMTVAIIVGNVLSWITYVVTILFGKPHRMSGNVLYDMFMGAPLNPRIGRLDLKMFVEIRIPWVILFFISVSAALKQYDTYGYISAPLLFMVLAHYLYVNACMKGEECIPTTWDIFYEKWGYMLIFWNLAGVPFTYCYSSLYLLQFNPPLEHSTPYTIGCFVLLLSGYYIWDTANSQKARFRMQLRGTYIPRMTFPQLPWGTLKNPTYIKTKHGNLLLTSGWYALGRKIHYTGDLMMALSWGLITGYSSPVPYFYVSFFIVVLIHRVSRDMERCARKYGADWDEYCKKVPYIFIPYIF